MRVCLALCLGLFVATAAASQGARTLPLTDPAYEHLAWLQRRGLLLELDPTAVPYRVGEVRRALRVAEGAELRPRERRRVVAVREAVGRPVHAREGAVLGGAALTLGARATNNDRLDPLRYTESGRASDGADASLALGPVNPFPYGLGWFGLGVGEGTTGVAAQLGWRTDPYLVDDPDGFPAAKRLVSRNEDSYVAAHGTLAGARIGRVDERWAGSATPALVLGDNARAFDALAVRIGGSRLSLTSRLGELDSANEDGTFTGRNGDTFRGDPGIRRFHAARRLAWRPSRRFQLTLQEAVVYSSPTASASLSYLAPTQAFALLVDSSPKNDEQNIIFSGSFWWHAGTAVLSGQVAIDDFDFGAEVPVLAGTGAVEVPRALGEADLVLGLTAVSSRSYNTDQAPGRYVFGQRGIATFANDYVHARAALAWADPAGAPGLTLTPEAQLLLQGEGTILEDRVPDGEASLLFGTVERTVRLGVGTLYTPAAIRLGPGAPPLRLFARADLGVNFTRNGENVPGADAARFVGVVGAGVKVRVGGVVRVDEASGE